jgi:hypothetical protein
MVLRSSGWALLAFISLIILPGCGSGGGSSTTPPPSFSLHVSPSSLSMAPGSIVNVQVSFSPVNSFSGSVTVNLTGLPTGVSSSPASPFTVSSSGQTVALTATTTATNGQFSLSFQGTSGNASSSASATLTIASNFASYDIVNPSPNEVSARLGSTATAVFPTNLTGSSGATNYTLALSVSGLPSGTTATFAQNPISPGTAATLNIVAAANAAVAMNQQLVVTTTPSVNLPVETASVIMNVAPAPGNIPDNRTDFIRTDGFVTAGVYDSFHQLIFSTNQTWNRVDVISPMTKQIVRSVSIPNPRALDLTLDGKRVLVGTDSQQVFAIDTTSLQIVQEWQLPNITLVGLSQSFAVDQLFVTSSNQVLMKISNSEAFAQWNPLTNSIIQIPLPGFIPAGYAARSGDATKVLLASDTEPGVAVLYDVASNTFTSTLHFPGFVFGVAASPDASRFLIFDDTAGIILYDNQLIPIGSVASGGLISGMIFSTDGSKVYVVGQLPNISAIFTTNVATLAFVGAAPAFAYIPPCCELIPSFVNETPFGSDSTGLIFGALDHGVVLDDASYFENILAQDQIGAPIFDKSVTPAFGPVGTATPVTFVTSSFDSLPDVFFGSQRALNASLDSGGILQVSAPPTAQSGPVNVKVIQPNGVQVFDPQVFSYGPAPLFVSGDAASPSGGAIADIIALGVPNDPSKVTVSIGGASANIISANFFTAIEQNFPNAYPFPAVDLKVQVPSNTPGAADIVVSDSAGTGTLQKAFHFVQSVADFSSTDTFQAILFDRFRNQLYLSAGDHVDVFSLSSKQFLSAFQPPSVSGTKQFTGMALTPDGSQLLIANLKDGSLAVLNPDNPSSAKADAISPATSSPNCLDGPAYVAATNTGIAFVSFGGVPGINCGPTGPLFQLNLATGAVSQATFTGGITCGSSYVSASRDGSKVSVGPDFCLYNSASNSWSSNNPLGGQNATAAAGDGNVFANSLHFLDASAFQIGSVTLTDVYYPNGLDFSTLSTQLPAFNEKLNDSGSLLYFPFTTAIDLTDVRQGVLRRRIMLTEEIAQVIDAMAIDTTGQNIFLITNKGLTIVQLDTVPISIGGVTPATASAGTQITIRGSGYLSGITATLNGATASVTVVDADTLQLNVPSIASGAVQIQLKNPDGSSYTLDDAFVIP